MWEGLQPKLYQLKHTQGHIHTEISTQWSWSATFNLLINKKWNDFGSSIPMYWIVTKATVLVIKHDFICSQFIRNKTVNLDLYLFLRCAGHDLYWILYLYSVCPNTRGIANLVSTWDTGKTAKMPYSWFIGILYIADHDKLDEFLFDMIHHAIWTNSSACVWNFHKPI